MVKLIMMKGLPGSGKTTHAKTLVDKLNMVRVNKDDLRSMLHNSIYSQENEKEVLKIRDFIIRNCLSQGRSVVVDDTNFSPAHAISLKAIAEDNKANFEEVFIDTPLEECIFRDTIRENQVGATVIIDMHDKYLK